MKFEKIIKRPDGTRYKIQVSFYADCIGGHRWDTMTVKAEPGKRKFSFKDVSEEITKGERLNAILDYWESIKPKYV